ncbi:MULTISPECIES: hypothetical protein [Lysobacter]|uniref:Uncharacterized protein n=1 Tax=Lysobacter firmicutimachus TaxID=1792846 RepID=A0ABU8CY82_9GAMM|nr:hypothetical protein [Lysobacter antibioticus]
MAKFLCKCLHVIGLVRTPAPEQYTMIPNVVLYDLVDRVEKKDMSGNALIAEVDRTGQDVIHCPKCGRVWIKGFDEVVYKAYVVEVDSE